MDIIDQAQQNDREFNEKALTEILKRRNLYDLLYDEKPLIVDGVHYCLDCGDEIPAARIAAKPNALRCIDCQAKKERK
jgi:DnaK suppressor protein